MNIWFVLTFLASAALGSYVQSVTGFAMGLIVVAVIAISGVAPLGVAAAALSIMTLCNAAVVLPKIWRKTDWLGIARMTGGLIPGLIGGVFLLSVLSTHYSIVLKFMVGILVMAAGSLLLVRPARRDTASGTLGFTVVGAAAGMLSGLFGTSGPPLVFHYYRQPISMDTIRATLITVFTLIAAGRTLLVTVQGQLDVLSIQAGLLAVPVVGLSSWLSVRFPPRLSDQALRRCAFALLVLMGGSTTLAAWLEFATT